MNLEKLVFIDESGAKTNMTRLYSRVKAGARATDAAPSGHWHNDNNLVDAFGWFNCLYGC